MFHIVKGKSDEFNPLYDTVGFVKDHYMRANCLVNEITDDQINILDNKLFFGAIQVNIGDVVWIKIDPDQSERYFLTLRMMVPFERNGVVFINPPSVILSYDDKTIPLITNEVVDQKILNSPNGIKSTKYYFGDTDDLVVKRLNGFGGRDVSIVPGISDLEIINDSAPYIVERSIAKEGTNIDSRVFWFNGEIVGVINRFGENNNLCNMTQGGGIELGDITKIMENPIIKDQINVISDFLKENKCLIAGIDVLNYERITEVNISNPSVFKNYIEMSGDNFLFNLEF